MKNGIQNLIKAHEQRIYKRIKNTLMFMKN